MVIPGWLIALLTFPGVMLHELAHKIFCDWFRVPVFEVRYFQFGERESGYVKHGEPKSFSQHLFICVGPLVVNSLVACLLGAMVAQAIEKSPLYWLLGWLAVSAGMHAFPSGQDARNIAEAARKARANGGSVLLIATFPFVALLHTANALRFLWFDALYAAFIVLVGHSIGEVLQ